MSFLTDDAIRQIVTSRVSVTREHIALVKGLLLKHFNTSTERMMHEAVRALGFERPSGAVRVGGTDATPALERLGDYFSWMLCAIEAVWELIHAGVLLPMSARELTQLVTNVQIMQDRGGGSGSTGSEDFNNFGGVAFFPGTVIKTRCPTAGFVLSDPDLYLDGLRPQVPQPDIAEALQEAVRCFRAERYMAAVVMLGKASEGLWIECGKALIDALPKPTNVKPTHEDLDSPNIGFAKKLRDVLKLYESKQPDYVPIAKRAGLSLDQVRLAAHWAETVRDSRNVVHYGAKPTMPHNYETVATLLLTGATHLRTVIALHDAALAHPVTADTPS
jgi:hypothetical protein